MSFETFPVASDPSPLFVGLPDDRCQCPHWGYVVHGSFSVNNADGEETFHAGDAYYLRPGAEGEDARAAHLAAYEAARRAADVGAMTEAALGLSRAQLFGADPGRIPALLFEAYQTAQGADRIRLAAALVRTWVYGGQPDRGGPSSGPTTAGSPG